MKKEKIKTGILIALLLNTLILTANVWFGSGLWPHGYDFFISLPNRAFFSQLFRKNQPYVSPMETLARPQRLVVTNGANRAVYYNSDASYAPFYESVKDFFYVTLADESYISMATEVQDAEWYDVLRNDEILDTRSVYVEYSTAFSPKLFAQITGIAATWLENRVSSVRDFIIAPVGAEGEDMLLYIREYDTGRIMKFYIQYPGKTALYQKIASLSEDANYSYAFELNLHDSQVGIGEGVEQKVVMEPLILISPRKTESVTITAENPITPSMDMDALLSVFRYRQRAVNRYVTTDGTTHFVENYGSIHIYPDGVVEYYAVEKDKGVSILPAGASAATLYDSLNGAVGFAAQVWNSLVPDIPFDALVEAERLEESPAGYLFTLDYYMEGTRIITAAQSETHSPLQHAVEIEVQDGRIVRYRHFIRRFTATDTKVLNPAMLEAIDGIYAQLANEEEKIQITDLFLGYIENATDAEKFPVWCAKLAGKESLVYYTAS